MDVEILTETQENALAQLERRLVDWSERIAGRFGGQSDRSNIFAIDGPRGAGKTTVLQALCRKAQALRAKGLLICPALDCSLILPDVSPSGALLLHLGEELRRVLEREVGERAANELGKLKKLQETSFQAAEVFQTLAVELSSSLGDFGHQVSKALIERIALRGELAQWTRRTCEILKVEAIVVLLDDFDLARGGTVRMFMRSMLDELRQDRLLFVLTADFLRLEHLSWDARAEIDDKTGRALLEKMIPAQNCERLKEWNAGDRESFQSTPTGESVSLWSLVTHFADGDRLQAALLKCLLPSWPRGLLNLYESLSGWHSSESGFPLSEERLSTFLGLLAGCRAEPLLARRLRTLPPSRLIEMLDLRDAEISFEQWRESVEASRSGFVEKEPTQPLPLILGLIPRPGILAAQGPQGVQTAAAGEDSLTYDLWARAPASRDPLRHDLQQVYPLRDSDPMSVPAWVELLANYGFSKDSGTVNAMAAVRHRIELLESWPATRQRAEAARFKLVVPTNALRSFFLDRDFLPRGCLLWMSWEVSGSLAIGEIGWWTLFETLRGVRDPLHVDLLTTLLLNPSQVKGAPPLVGDPEQLELLPDRLRALILLVDSLDRCPWTISGAALWGIDLYLGLVAVLVRTAYIHARLHAGLVDRSALSEVQLWFVDILERRDGLRILKSSEEDLRSRITDVLSDGWPQEWADSTDSLAPAARCYSASMAYQSVKELFGLAVSAGQPPP